MTDSNHNDDSQPDCDRRSFLKGLGAAAAGLAGASAASTLPHIWVPNEAYASTSARGEVEHLLYIRLAGGFRFTTAFNADVTDEYNPFGLADSRQVAAGTEWGVGKLLADAPWLEGDDPATRRRRQWGMQPVPAIADDIAVLPCIDHEPFAARADGNHGTGLERFQTGRLDGDTSFLTMINYGLRERFRRARENQETASVALPAFSLGDAGMANGAGDYSGHRPPVIRAGYLDEVGIDTDANVPDWARQMAREADGQMRDRQNAVERRRIEAYIDTREAGEAYGEIFNDQALQIRNDSDKKVAGFSNAELADIFGDTPGARRVRLALRLFHFGAPAVYLNQGSYDLHSAERNRLPDMIDELTRIISGLQMVLKSMTHPAGGTYWDKTLVVFGSEFGRTGQGSKFNSASGSDHTGDLATRWMSMPVMGGVISQAGNGGRVFGATRKTDLKAQGPVYSYRSMLKTLMDTLGCDHSEFFRADEPFDALFT